MRRLGIALLMSVVCSVRALAGDPQQLYYALRDKVLAVKDYTADVKMKIDIDYMKIPQLDGKLYFKSPDKMKMVRKDGISILPKKNINLALGSLIPPGNVTVIDVGTAVMNGKTLRVLKVIPEADNTGIILTKVWIDEANVMAWRTETTTRDEGTVVMELTYGKYAKYSLPDKISIIMDVKEYKLPAGVTMDYREVPQDKPKPKDDEKAQKKKGSINIAYSNYVVNKGLDDAIFADPKPAKK
jgi:outer membrane lipoprotein-sorting protein